jgi:hypothetical protein
VVIERDGRLEDVRRAIVAREEARQAVAALSDDELLSRYLGIPHRPSGTARGEFTERDDLRGMVGSGVRWMELRHGIHWSKGSNQEWPGETDFVREPYGVELKSRWTQQGDNQRNAGRQAVRNLITDQTRPLMERIFYAASSGMGSPVPDRAAAMLASRDEFERALAIISIAALGQCGDVAIAVREPLDWYAVRECARRVLESVLPDAAADDAAGAQRYGLVTGEDLGPVRKALVLIDQPLPEVADDLEQFLCDHQNAPVPPHGGWKYLELIPRMLDDFRRPRGRILEGGP